MAEEHAGKDIRVFTGPSLSPREARSLLPSAACHPPAALGDIYRAAKKRPRAIVLIDGYFENRPAVWHKEILWALHQGIAVYGAASMGALRALEMAPFGMTGVGRIFRDYRDGRLEDDDDVAVVHAPEELDFAPLTEAMVNVAATLDRALGDGLLDDPVERSLRTAAKSQHYRERSWPSVIAGVERTPDTGRQLDAFARWVETNAVNQKRIDAIEALSQALTGSDRQDDRPEATSTPDPPILFEENHYWNHIVAGTTQSLLDAGDLSACRKILSEEGGVPEPYRSRALLRALALFMAKRELYPIDSRTLLEQFRRHRDSFELSDGESLQRWLELNGMNEAALNKLMQDNAMIDAVIARLEPRLLEPLLDELRLSGDYDPMPETTEP